MSEKAYYFVELIGDRAEAAWDELVTYALGRANFFEVTAPKWTEISGWRLKKRQWQLPAHLAPYLVQQYESNWVYQARQRKLMTYYRFRLTPEMVDFVQAEPLWAWNMASGLPEDPAFYQDEAAILWTISHEQYAFVWLTPDEAQAWREAGFAEGIRDFSQIENRQPPTKRP